MSDSGEGLAVTALAELISEQLVEERARKTSLEERGIGLITTSGAFTTLVLAIAALVGEEKLVAASRALLVFSLMAFIAAALMGVVVNHPVDYEESSEASLRSVLREHGDKSSLLGQRAAAENRLTMIRHARAANGTKACWLRRGTQLQILAMALVGLAGVFALIQ